MFEVIDTIVAVASPPGRSARGIVRVSGPGAAAIASSLTARVASEVPIAGRLDPAQRVSDFKRRAVHRVRLDALGGLPAWLCWFPATASYTGEDAFELQAPGNPLLLERIVQRILQCQPVNGSDPSPTGRVRRAEAGEFTARAFFNGRLTLTEAEGVAMTIAAASDAELRAARMLTGGRLHARAAELADQLAVALALVEAGIDFTDQEDVVPIDAGDLRVRVREILNAIDDLLNRSVGAEQISALPRVVLVGPPNAGKSTLFNRLLGRERAVVSAVSGTTRDVLVEPMHLEPGNPLSPEIMLIDIAGLEAVPSIEGGADPDEEPRTDHASTRHGLSRMPAPSDRDLGFGPGIGSGHNAQIGEHGLLHSQMQRAARRAIDEADLLICVQPLTAAAALAAESAAQSRSCSHPRTAGSIGAGTEAAAADANARTLHVMSKVDAWGPPAADAGEGTAANPLRVSAFSGYGLDRLRVMISERLRHLPSALTSDALVLLPRHEAALRSAREQLTAALGRLEMPNAVESRALPEPELLAAELRLALDAFGRLVGHITPDDVLGQIFGKFCVGK